LINLTDIKVVYFIGIGGIGMSALARHFRQGGAEVHGYDRTRTELTRALEGEGIHIHYDENLNAIPKSVDLVIYTPAIPSNHSELQYCLKQDWPVKKRAEVLGLITKDKYTIAIAGTHGKTTITAMVAQFLQGSESDATAFIGGIPIDLGTNYISGNSDVIVVEADEYDRSFHQLKPDVAIVTAIDNDHLDIYGTREALVASYQKFLGQVKSGGTIILHEHVNIDTTALDAEVLTYAHSYGENESEADFQITSLENQNGTYHYALQMPQEEDGKTFRLNIGGTYNVLNTVPAIAVARMRGLSLGDIGIRVERFSGIQRRFEYILKTDRRIFIDDYAHHPKEIKVLLESVRHLFPEKKMTVIFQPHLFSRTRDLADGFAESLSIADDVLLLSIYPAREEPIEGVTSEIIESKLNNCDAMIVSKEGLISEIETRKPELLLTVGAGDINELIPILKQAF